MYGDAFEHIRRTSANPIQMLKKLLRATISKINIQVKQKLILFYYVQ